MSAHEPRILKIAVVSGPQYDRLYDRLSLFEQQSGHKVEIVFRGSHPALNDYLAASFKNYNNAAPCSSSPELDLISTHIKYAPSQVDFLQELDNDQVTPAERSEFLETALEASKVQGKLYQLPRMVDSRVLFYRADIFDQLSLKAPATWEEVLVCAQAIHAASAPIHAASAPIHSAPMPASAKDDIQGYVFPGKLSGLFGTFYELAMMQMTDPEALFDRNDRPVFDETVVAQVLLYLRHMVESRAVPQDIETLYFDEVSSMFADGKVAMVADWPSYYGVMKKKILHANAGSSAAPRIGVIRYPHGANGKRSAYSGMHSFAIPKSARDPEASLALLKFLVDDDQQWIEASESGSFPTKKSVLQRLVAETEHKRDCHPDDLEAKLDCERLACLEQTIKNDMAMFPHLKTYPELEDALYPLIQDAMMGRISAKEAAKKMKEIAQRS
ncbi:hypothetical protein BGZ74_004690 [Mortierella antarctica]|nr:hypothetical protein BGZ74_004690 [Mortierella antarctica]